LLSDGAEDRRRKGEIHDQGVELADMLVVDVARPARDIAQSHAEEDRDQ
jgi:hypothetical protein